MTDDLTPLPEDIQELLAQDLRPEPPVDFDARVLGRIQASLGGGGPGGGGPSGGGPSGGGAGDGGPSVSGSPVRSAIRSLFGLPSTIAALAIGAAGGWVA